VHGSGACVAWCSVLLRRHPIGVSNVELIRLVSLRYSGYHSLHDVSVTLTSVV